MGKYQAALSKSLNCEGYCQPRRLTALRFTRTDRDAKTHGFAMRQRSGSCRVQPLVGRRRASKAKAQSCARCAVGQTLLLDAVGTALKPVI